MTLYKVHLYRVMRRTFDQIEAETPEAAAAIAHDRLTEDAADIEDCNGEDLGALVDVVGDEQYEQSVSIDFKPDRRRQAAARSTSSGISQTANRRASLPCHARAGSAGAGRMPVLDDSAELEFTAQSAASPSTSSKDTPMTSNAKPVYKIRAGALSVSIWKNEGDKGSW
jgi:hypothetical protein